MCSLRTLLRETPRFTHLFYLLEVSINEVSCFSRIPVFPVVFNHISNKPFQFLPFTKEIVVGSREEIHYSWKGIVELMEKTTVKWTRGWDSVPHSMSLLYLHLALGVTLDSSSLPQSSSFPSGLHQNTANFEPLLTTLCIFQFSKNHHHFLPGFCKASNTFHDSLLNPFPSLSSTEQPEGSFNSSIDCFTVYSSIFWWLLMMFRQTLHPSPGLELYMSWLLTLMSLPLLSLTAILALLVFLVHPYWSLW